MSNLFFFVGHRRHSALLDDNSEEGDVRGCPAAVRAGKNDDDTWCVDENALSVGSTAAGSTCSSSSIPDLVSISFDLANLESSKIAEAQGRVVEESDEDFVTPRLGLCDGLFFHEPASCAGEAEDRVLRRADVVVPFASGEVRVFSSSPLEGDVAQQSTVSNSRVPTAEDLLVDCRAEPQDDAKLVKLVGAKLCTGRILRLVIQPGFGLEADVCCEIADGFRASAETSTRLVPVAEAVAAVREAQRRRDAAALEMYQRQLCSRLNGQQRRRAMGLA